jgi:hypothetical protein
VPVVGWVLEAVVRLVEEDFPVPGWVLEDERTIEEEPLDLEETWDGA